MTTNQKDKKETTITSSANNVIVQDNDITVLQSDIDRIKPSIGKYIPKKKGR